MVNGCQKKLVNVVSVHVYLYAGKCFMPIIVPPVHL